MDIKMQKSTQDNKPDNSETSKKIFETLENIAKTAKNSSLTTFNFANLDTNSLKNTILSKISTSDFPEYHRHDFFEINYCIEGMLYEHVSGSSIVLKQGDILIMAPGIFHTCHPDEKSTSFNIILKKEWTVNVANGFKAYDPSNYLTSLIDNRIYTIISASEHSEKLNKLVLEMYKMHCTINHHVDLFENLSLENKVSEFLLFLTKLPRHEYPEVASRGNATRRYTPDDIARYINDNFDKINLSDTASLFGYSRSQFHRIIKKITGKSFSELILSMRMQKARHYLLNTTLSIKNIAYLLGLDSAEHFTRMFKKHRNMTPKEYRDAYMRDSIRKK